MGATHFRLRTLEKVSAEMSLHVLAYNLKRMIAILGVEPLIQPGQFSMEILGQISAEIDRAEPSRLSQAP